MTMTRIGAALGVAAMLTVGAAVATAHHGTLVSYDREKQWTAKATVTEFRYLNPHAQIYFDIVDEKRQVVHWSGELLANPAQLIATGWTRKRSMEALKAGTPITITVAPARAGGNAVLVLRIVDQAGQEVLGGAAPAGAPPRPTP
jgi:hypothetical protein